MVPHGRSNQEAISFRDAKPGVNQKKFDSVSSRTRCHQINLTLTLVAFLLRRVFSRLYLQLVRNAFHVVRLLGLGLG